MPNATDSPTTTLDSAGTPPGHEPIRFAGGLTENDRPLVEETLRRTVVSFGRTGRAVDAELSVKDRGNPGMRTTLELWAPGQPRLVASSDLRDLRDALNEIGDRATRLLDEQRVRSYQSRTSPAR